MDGSLCPPRAALILRNVTKMEEHLNTFYEFLGREVCATAGLRITPAQALTILLIPEHGSCVQSQLPHFGSNGSHAAKMLVAKGYLTKSRGKRDTRTFVLTLTDLGRQLRKRFEESCEHRAHLAIA
jgi:DNA-binding MarR family transcriptional regulator